MTAPKSWIERFVIGLPYRYAEMLVAVHPCAWLGSGQVVKARRIASHRTEHSSHPGHPCRTDAGRCFRFGPVRGRPSDWRPRAIPQQTVTYSARIITSTDGRFLSSPCAPFREVGGSVVARIAVKHDTVVWRDFAASQKRTARTVKSHQLTCHGTDHTQGTWDRNSGSSPQ